MCFFWRYISFFRYFFLSSSFVTVSELFCCEFFQAFVILPCTTYLPRQRFCFQSNLLFFDIALLYYYFNLRWSIVFGLFSGDISFFRYFFIILIRNCLWIILLWVFWNFCDVISNSITNQITSCFCCFLSRSFWSSFKRIFCKLFSMIKTFLTVFTIQVLLIFSLISLPTFLAKDKNP